MLFISGFVDDDMFSYNELHGGLTLLQQRYSLQRRACWRPCCSV